MLHNKITSEKKREMFKVNCVQAARYCVCMGERQIEGSRRCEGGMEVHERRFYCSLIVGDIKMCAFEIYSFMILFLWWWEKKIEIFDTFTHAIINFSSRSLLHP